MKGKVLILGASGRFGRHAAEAFSNARWQVQPYSRGTDELMAAAKGADVIVYGWNPAYPDWAREVPVQVGRVIAAAEASGATVILPGNVYVFGPGAPDILGATTPHRAENPLGRIRREMEAALRTSGVQTIVLRAGDFLDTQASGNWFDMVMSRRLDRGTLVCPGATDIPHAWAYLPDMARAAVGLVDIRDRLGGFEDVPFPGYTLTGNEIAAVLSHVLRRPVTARKMNWLPLRLAWPFWPMARALLEMRYLWNKPHRLDGARLAELLPDFEGTPVDTALASAIQHDIDPDEAVPGQVVTLHKVA